MKTAFTHWDNHIAPLFDTARTIRIIETDTGGSIIDQHDESLPDDLLFHKITRLREFAVNTLVCGAISRPAHDMIAANSIRIIPFIAGEIDTIITAWLSNRLQQDRFAMPGCCGRRRQNRWCGDHHSQEVITMNFFNNGQGRGQGGTGRGQGGQGRNATGRGQGRGRMGGPLAAGPAGTCVCPKCGHTEPHQRGLPCVERQCPKCGTVMARQ